MGWINIHVHLKESGKNFQFFKVLTISVVFLKQHKYHASQVFG